MLVVILGVLGFLTLMPFVMLLELSLKSQQQMVDQRWLPTWPIHPENYVNAFRVMQPYMINSVVFVVGAVVISIVFSVLSAYALARYDFPGREFFYILILSLLMIPGILTLFPMYALTIKLSLNNTNWGVWLPLATASQAFQIVVLRTFFSSIPVELFEAGRMDGASETTMLVKIALPLAKPILSTLIVLHIMTVWNEYIWPIIVLADADRYPVLLAVLRLGERFGSLTSPYDPGAMFAAYTISGLPILILFIFTSRSFIRGLTSGAVKM